MDNSAHVAAGGRLRDRFGERDPASLFAVLGVLLLAGGVAVPDFETLLFAWGGTALFAAFLLRVVTRTVTLPAAVTTDVHATMARNARRLTGGGSSRYVPEDGSVALAVDGSERRLDPVGERLLATVDDAPDATVEERLPVLVDALVNDLELAGRASAVPVEGGVEVTVTDSRVGTDELFDHPVASVLGVGLVRVVGGPVRVEPVAEGEQLILTCRFE
ncbi:hypothetical protein KTS45_07130 [Halomicroarcula limicola]|uniref:DUF7982 domain-containing protein n=1 Tax=Haloarcula limicola TaxID=1429915 RepID=A0A8J7Y9Y7_9EURY|nr:hypothetical protein [Halomicroarcula limicola]MBV0923974.1 hypothetical protein [Halomicroarcula limicola]